MEVQKSDIKFIYQSVEQSHSTNADSINEKSHKLLKKSSNLLDTIETTCNKASANLTHRIKPCQFSNVLLVTRALNLNDLTYINTKVSPHFPYIIVCLPSLTSNGFINTTSMTSNYFVTFVSEANFSKCAETAKLIGFKQQAYLFAENIRDFLFWTDGIEIQKINSGFEVNMLTISLL